MKNTVDAVTLNAMNNLNVFLGTVAVSLALLFCTHAANAQPFTITSAGEMNLDTDLVNNEGSVTKYFGMYVEGSGESIIRVRVGDQSAERSYEFQLTNTRMTSFLFNGVLAEDISIDFRRGVKGFVSVEILDANGALNSTADLELDVTMPRRHCQKYTSTKLKKCARVDLSKATAGNRRRLAKKLLSSIKGPIILEP